MTKRMTKVIILIIAMILAITSTVNTAFASEMSFNSKKTYSLETKRQIFDNALWGYQGEGDAKSKTMKINVPSGTLYIDSLDWNTPFSITITDSKKKTVKTIKSEKQTLIEMGEEAVLYRVFTGVALSKGTYKISFKSSSDINLNGYTSFVLLSNKSKTIDITDQTDIAVTKDKTYKFAFTIAEDGTYDFGLALKPYDINLTGLEEVAYNILNAEGKVMATKKEEGDSILQKKLSAGEYTLEMKAMKDGILSIFVDKDE